MLSGSRAFSPFTPVWSIATAAHDQPHPNETQPEPIQEPKPNNKKVRFPQLCPHSLCWSPWFLKLIDPHGIQVPLLPSEGLSHYLRRTGSLRS